MGFYTDLILPRVINVVMDSKDLEPIRSRVCSGLSGEVLEIGFGSGLNVPFYPAAVTRVRAVDPAVLGRKLAARRVASSAAGIEFLGLDGQDLPLAEASADHVLMTWTLCTVPDPERTLAEIRRVLRPGGSLRFAEHGLAPDERVARWQQRLTPINRRIAGGCHLNRQASQLVAASGLDLTSIDTYYVAGPKPFGYTFEGTAVKA